MFSHSKLRGFVGNPAARHKTTITPHVVVQCSMRHSQDRVRRRENVEGSFWVDSTCIDCDACRWMAPETFTRKAEASAVHSQPETPEQRHAALQALLACPTFSIHVDDASPGEMAAARDTFPALVPGTERCYHVGFHDKASFGAVPYFIKRSEGNIMVDVPRWNPQLAQRLKSLGGVKYIFLTHRDDVGEHARWAEHFGATRIIHATEANARQGTDQAEWKLDGEGPWSLGEDVQLLFTPGHTAGCVSLLYPPDKALFPGDHLAHSHRLNRLTIFRAYNWYSVPLQLESLNKLVGLDFLHILPGHGRRCSFPSVEEKDAALRHCLEEEGFRGN